MKLLAATRSTGKQREISRVLEPAGLEVVFPDDVGLHQTQAEDLLELGDSFEIITDPSNTVPVRTAVQQAGMDYESAEVSFVPEYTQEVDAPTAEKLLKIIDALEDSDDVQNVYANFDASDEVLASIG